MRAHRARQILLAVCLATLAVAVVPAQRGAPPPGIAPAPGGPPAPPPVTGTGAISGVVIDGTTKQPIAGAVVTIAGGARGAAPQPRIVSDPKGRFVFRDLTAYPTYSLTATKPGYTFTTPRPLDMGDRTGVADGAWVSDLTLVLWHLSSISGTVVDERGEPVVGVPVNVLARVPVAGTTHLASAGTTRTDDRGAYRIAGLRAGSYIAMVPSVQAAVPATTPVALIAGGSPELLAAETAIGRIAGVPNMAGVTVGDSRLVIGNYATPPPLNGRPQAYPVVFHPGLRSPTRAPSIQLGYGDERQGVDFALQPVAAASVSGHVVGPPEAWTGLVLRLLVEGGEDLGLGKEQATALVGSDGSFSFLAVPTGTYTIEGMRSFSEYSSGSGGLPGLSGTPGLVVSGSGAAGPVESAPEWIGLTSRLTAADSRYWARERVDVGPAGVPNMTLTLRSGATFSGRFVYEGTPRPPGFAALLIEPAEGQASRTVRTRPLPTAGPPIRSDEFSVSGLTDGEYFLRLSGPALSSLVKSVVAGGADYTERPFDASRGDLTDVVITLTDKPATLAGTVRDRRGTPVADAAVVVFPTDRAMWVRYGLTPPRIKTAATSKQGTYNLRGLPQGEYFVVAVASMQRDMWMDSRFFPSVATQASRVSLDWGATQTVDVTMTEVTLP